MSSMACVTQLANSREFVRRLECLLWILHLTVERGGRGEGREGGGEGGREGGGGGGGGGREGGRKEGREGGRESKRGWKEEDGHTEYSFGREFGYHGPRRQDKTRHNHHQ